LTKAGTTQPFTAWFCKIHPRKVKKQPSIHLGAILQVLNDLFDIYKDHHNGVQTLVTNTADIPFIAKELKALESTFMAQYQALDYPATAKQNH
jgi:hypothetical protein